jgi:hypothetical protein
MSFDGGGLSTLATSFLSSGRASPVETNAKSVLTELCRKVALWRSRLNGETLRAALTTAQGDARLGATRSRGF